MFPSPDSSRHLSTVHVTIKPKIAQKDTKYAITGILSGITPTKHATNRGTALRQPPRMWFDTVIYSLADKTTSEDIRLHGEYQLKSKTRPISG